MPRSPVNESSDTKTRQTVDQPRDSDHASGMLAAVVTIGGGDTLKPSNLSDGLFDYNPKLRKCAVVDSILWWTIFAARLAPGRKAFFTQFCQFQLGQITSNPDFLWQAGQQAALFQQPDVRRWSRYTGGYIDNASGVAVYRHLTFERMLLFLARIVAVIVGWTLDTLLKTIHNHTQFGNVCQQIRQLASPLLARIRQAHRIASGLFQQRQHALNQARDCRVAYPKQLGQHLINGVQTQPDDSQQHMVADSYLKGMSSAYRPLALRPVEAACFGFQLHWQYIIHYLVKQADG